MNKNWFFIVLIAATQLACSSSSSDGINYRKSVITPTLELPPDLVSTESNKNLSLPGSSVGTAENKGRFVETGNMNVDNRTLPKIDGVELHQDNGIYWLSVQRPVEQVFPLLRKYWADQGFRLIKDEPQLGLMETEWLSMKSGNDSFFASMLATMRAAESRDKYVTRVERDGDSATRVYIVHRGKELVVDENTDALDNTGLKSGWQFVPSDNSKEVEMLKRFMIFLGLKDAQVEQQLDRLAPLQPRSKLELDKDDLPYVLVQGGLQQTLNRLRYRMDKLAVAIRDLEMDGEQATLKLDGKTLGELAVIEKGDQDIAIRLEDSVGSNTTRIDVLGSAGSSVHDRQAVKLLNFLTEQLK